MIYLDHNSTTPVDPRVLEVMLPLFSAEFGNAASRTHRFGWYAAQVVEGAQELAVGEVVWPPRAQGSRKWWAWQ